MECIVSKTIIVLGLVVFFLPMIVLRCILLVRKKQSYIFGVVLFSKGDRHSKTTYERRINVDLGGNACCCCVSGMLGAGKRWGQKRGTLLMLL